MNSKSSGSTRTLLGICQKRFAQVQRKVKALFKKDGAKRQQFNPIGQLLDQRLILISGKMATGKTTSALWLAENRMIKHGHDIVFFSNYQPSHQWEVPDHQQIDYRPVADCFSDIKHEIQSRLSQLPSKSQLKPKTLIVDELLVDRRNELSSLPFDDLRKVNIFVVLVSHVFSAAMRTQKVRSQENPFTYIDLELPVDNNKSQCTFTFPDGKKAEMEMDFRSN